MFAIRLMVTIFIAAGYLLATLFLMAVLEPGMTPPGFTGRGAYALIIILIGTFHLAGRWRRTIPFMIFGAAAAAMEVPAFFDNDLRWRLGDHSYSLEIWAATIGWCVFVVTVSLSARMMAIVRWRLIRKVPLEHPLCRKCGYDIRFAQNVCSECGTAFDRGDLNSLVATRKQWDFRWLGRTIGRAILFVVLPLVGFYTVLYFRSDTRSVAAVEAIGGQVDMESDLPRWLTGWPAALPTDWIEKLFSHPTSVMWRGTTITDAQLSCLRPLNRVNEIHIDNSPLTGSGFAALLPFGNLKSLYLPGSRIDDNGLIAIGQLTSLGDLQLDSSDVTDAGLTRLANLKHLQYLRLEHISITDEGLMQLTKLPSLNYLDIVGAKVTPNGVRKFQQRRPDVKVDGP